jgi:hypothetical protein
MRLQLWLEIIVIELASYAVEGSTLAHAPVSGMSNS